MSAAHDSIQVAISVTRSSLCEVFCLWHNVWQTNVLCILLGDVRSQGQGLSLLRILWTPPSALGRALGFDVHARSCRGLNPLVGACKIAKVQMKGCYCKAKGPWENRSETAPMLGILRFIHRSSPSSSLQHQPSPSSSMVSRESQHDHELLLWAAYLVPVHRCECLEQL